MSSKYETRLFLNNQFVQSASPNPSTFQVVDPTNLKPIADVVIASKEDIDIAVENAKKAFPAWRDLAASERSKCIRRLADLLRENSDAIAELEMAAGKPVTMAKAMAARAADGLDYYARLAEGVHGDSSLNTPGHFNVSVRQPFGVTAGILPFNVPLGMWADKIGPSVAAGNTIITKSSEKAPLLPLFASSLVAKAGFPPGVIQTVSGAGDTGKHLAEHMEIRKIAFTGSVNTGKRVMNAGTSSNLKNVTLELGGKSPAIIFGDIDLKKVIAPLCVSIQRNAGQVCMASTRIYVEESIAPAFTEAFTKAFEVTQTGDVHDPNTAVGAVIDKLQADRVDSFLEIGQKEGKLATGGRKTDTEGLFFQPTIFTNVPEDARLNKEEIFGPVAIVHTFKTEEEAIRKSNDTEYGLYASVFTKDIDRAIRVGKALEAGHVAINTTSPDTSFDMPFGGYKQSGVGRERGKDALDAWLEKKSLIIKFDTTS